MLEGEGAAGGTGEKKLGYVGIEKLGGFKRRTQEVGSGTLVSIEIRKLEGVARGNLGVRHVGSGRLDDGRMLGHSGSGKRNVIKMASSHSTDFFHSMK